MFIWIIAFFICIIVLSVYRNEKTVLKKYKIILSKKAKFNDSSDLLKRLVKIERNKREKYSWAYLFLTFFIMFFINILFISLIYFILPNFGIKNSLNITLNQVFDTVSFILLLVSSLYGLFSLIWRWANKSTIKYEKSISIESDSQLEKYQIIYQKNLVELDTLKDKKNNLLVNDLIVRIEICNDEIEKAVKFWNFYNENSKLLKNNPEEFFELWFK
ncbi:hypothetical protein MENTO_v1c03260 [Mesoplasma entomophilum]|nr:hypothetical protein MENTO_v1c03260 [Mesoplasma entomophilum]